MAEFLTIFGNEIFQGRGIGVEVNEHPTLPHATANRLQPAVIEIEVFDVVHVGGADELAAQVVCPCVVWATESFEVAVAGCNFGAAVNADVVESVDLTVGIPGDDDGFTDDIKGHVIAGLLDFLDAGDSQPILLEDLLLFELEDLVGCIDIAWQMGRFGQRLARLFDSGTKLGSPLANRFRNTRVNRHAYSPLAPLHASHRRERYHKTCDHPGWLGPASGH